MVERGKARSMSAIALSALKEILSDPSPLFEVNPGNAPPRRQERKIQLKVNVPRRDLEEADDLAGQLRIRTEDLLSYSVLRKYGFKHAVPSQGIDLGLTKPRRLLITGSRPTGFIDPG
jgi:hypothetical protein